MSQKREETRWAKILDQQLLTLLNIPLLREGIPKVVVRGEDTS